MKIECNGCNKVFDEEELIGVVSDGSPLRSGYMRYFCKLCYYGEELIK